MQNKSGKDKVALKPPSYEQVYQLTNLKKWSELIRLAYEHSKEIASDDMLENAFKVFEREFIRNLENSDESQDYL